MAALLASLSALALLAVLAVLAAQTGVRAAGLEVLAALSATGLLVLTAPRLLPSALLVRGTPS